MDSFNSPEGIRLIDTTRPRICSGALLILSTPLRELDSLIHNLLCRHRTYCGSFNSPEGIRLIDTVESGCKPEIRGKSFQLP